MSTDLDLIKERTVLISLNFRESEGWRRLAADPGCIKGCEGHLTAGNSASVVKGFETVGSSSQGRNVVF